MNNLQHLPTQKHVVIEDKLATIKAKYPKGSFERCSKKAYAFKKISYSKIDKKQTNICTGHFNGENQVNAKER